VEQPTEQLDAVAPAADGKRTRKRKKKKAAAAAEPEDTLIPSGQGDVDDAMDDEQQEDAGPQVASSKSPADAPPPRIVHTEVQLVDDYRATRPMRAPVEGVPAASPTVNITEAWATLSRGEDIDWRLLSVSQRKRLRRKMKEAGMHSGNAEAATDPKESSPATEPEAASPAAAAPTPAIDYTTCTKLTSLPPVGATIAYRTLEMTDSYCPAISDYKHAQVLLVDYASSMITLKLEAAFVGVKPVVPEEESWGHEERVAEGLDGTDEGGEGEGGLKRGKFDVGDGMQAESAEDSGVVMLALEELMDPVLLPMAA
jgi:hypothetical protein